MEISTDINKTYIFTCIILLIVITFIPTCIAFYYHSKYNELLVAKDLLETNYETEKKSWETTIDEQNKKIESFLVNTSNLDNNVDKRIKEIKTKSSNQQIQVSNNLSKDSSVSAQVEEVERILHEFSENK
jgi:flagellar basal body-associated protein FliL